MNKKIKKCEFCKKDATCLCFKCMTYFCDSCFKLGHEEDNFKNHKKDKMDLYAPIDIKCPQHNLHPMDLFCINEKGE